MELIALLEQKTKATVSEIESAMQEGGYIGSDFEPTFTDSAGYSAGQGFTAWDGILTVKHKVTGTERRFEMTSDSWEEQLKQDLRDQVFGH